MSNLTEKQKTLISSMPGTWLAEFTEKPKKIAIKLHLGKGYFPTKSEIVWKENGKVIFNDEFDTPHDFFGDYLVEGPYIVDVRRSNGDTLFFGISESAYLGDVDFKEFHRISTKSKVA